MQHPKLPASPANNSNRSDTPASDKADLQASLTEMFIGYLVNAIRIKLDDVDAVHAAYITMVGMIEDSEPQAMTEPAKPKPAPIMGSTIKEAPAPFEQYYTVSNYAAKIGIKGFNGQMASRLSRIARLMCKNNNKAIRYDNNTLTFPASVLKQVFSQFN